MTSPLSNPAFRTLFAAQVFSLLAIGLLTVALSLLAYRIGGDAAAGRILGMLLALKMVAYVSLAPLAESALAGVPRKSAMLALNAGRMVLLLPFAFVGEVWQVAALGFAVFAFSSAFTPLFQSTLPDLLKEEETYSRALAWSRIAYTLEAFLSPLIAAALLQVATPSSLFLCASLSFAASILALAATRFPDLATVDRKLGFWKRASRGMTIYRRTPRLRGLFLFNLALSLVMAWVIVNSVVFAGLRLGNAEQYFPWLMAGFGLGSVGGALCAPALVRRAGERQVIAAGCLIFAALGLLPSLAQSFPLAVVLWAGFGFAASLALTPGGLVIARSADGTNRPAVFAAQFSLSHAGWLVAYPLAGWLAAGIGMEPALWILSGLCVMCTVLALFVWPADDPAERPHSHADLPENHPHFQEAPATGPAHRHSHAYLIDELHPHWSSGSM